MSSIRSRFAAQVRAGRKAKALTHEQLAELAQCSVGSISNIERGVSASTLELGLALVGALDLNLTKLLDQRLVVRHVSVDRLEIEAGLGSLAGGLSDRDLDLLINLARAMTTQNSSD